MSGGLLRDGAQGRANGDADLAAGDEEDATAVASKRDAGGGAPEDRRIPPIVSHWNLAEYLPASVRQVFLVGPLGGRVWWKIRTSK